ncbi:MAG: S8 family serine peptidase [Bdellovibrionales bacterium]|nr:S8 family serine peptidase [Bdellovibrionales bacterium]
MQQRRLQKLFCWFSVTVLGLASKQGAWALPVRFRDGEFVIKMKYSDSKKVLTPQLRDLGLSFAKVITRNGDTQLVKLVNPAQAVSVFGALSPDKLAAQIVGRLSSLSEIAYAEPNYVYTTQMGAPTSVGGNPIPKNPPPHDSLPTALPNDAQFGSLWQMQNVGQKDDSGRDGIPGADIRAAKAWMISKGSRKVVVGVVDTGIDYTHPDLKANVWTRAKTKPSDPDVHGYNAITDALDPMDDNGHGSHCAGSIGAVGDNDVGVVGVNWEVTIMSAKFLDKDGSGSLDNAIKAIDWAVDNGAQILSNSWGGGGKSQALEDAIKRAAAKGVLFVAAAGNGGFDGIGDNNDYVASYPASYKLENVVSVAASNNVDQMSSFSNFGKKSVHLMAPGEKILSTIPGEGYQVYSGTSMATPHVAGAAALLLAKEPHLSAAQIRDRLVSSVYKIPEYQNKLISGGRLDLYSLLTEQSAEGFIDEAARKTKAKTQEAKAATTPRNLQ